MLMRNPRTYWSTRETFERGADTKDLLARVLRKRPCKLSQTCQCIANQVFTSSFGSVNNLLLSSDNSQYFATTTTTTTAATTATAAAAAATTTTTSATTTTAATTAAAAATTAATTTAAAATTTAAAATAIHLFLQVTLKLSFTVFMYK